MILELEISKLAASKTLYEELLEVWAQPKCWELLGDISEALEEEGHRNLARAYAWAAENKKWPQEMNTGKTMRLKEYKGDCKCYDWDSMTKDLCPMETRLPHDLYRAICQLQGRKYGGVDQDSCNYPINLIN